MQDNSHSSEYDMQQQNTLYDDQRTIPILPGYEVPTSSSTEQTVPFSQFSEVPASPYEQGFMPPELPYGQNALPQEGMLSETIPSAPEPPKKKLAKKILIVSALLLLLLLVIGGAVLLPNVTATANTQSATPVSTPVVKAQPAKKGIYAPYLARYRTTIRSQIALGLHLSADQLKAQLKAGKTLSSIASVQGISSSQLQTLVTNAFQQGFQSTVGSGGMTQQQVDALIKRMLKQPQTLDRYLSV